MDGATGTGSTTDERTDEHVRTDGRSEPRSDPRSEPRTDGSTDGRHHRRTDARALDLTESILAPDAVARPDAAEHSRPLVRHGSDLLDLVAGGVPFAVAHDVRASSQRPAAPTDS